MLRRCLPVVFAWTTARAACSVTTEPQDVVFVLDKSGSVANIANGWEDQTKFTAELIKGLSDGSRVATMAFSESFKVLHELGVKDPQTVAGEVRNVDVKLGGKTNTGQALKRAMKAFGDNNTNHKKIVLVTDGAPTDDSCIVKQELIQKGIKLIILLVGSDNIITDKKKAAQLEDLLECYENNGDNSVVEKAKNFEEMSKHLDAVTRSLCTIDDPVLPPVIPEPHPIPEPDPNCYPTECLARCDAKYSSSDAYYCKKGCATMENKNGKKVVADPTRFCRLKAEMSASELYELCLVRCNKASEKLARQGMCRFGCENWAPDNAVI